MIVAKKSEIFRHTQLEVERWKVTHNEEGKLVETYDGLKIMEEKTGLTFLGAVISNDGKNNKNIKNKIDKSRGLKRQIQGLVKGLDTYTFECGMIYINSMLRDSLLYSAEAMYDIKEEEFNLLERREEENMKLLVETLKSAPLHMLYLELGQIPARYLVKGNMVMYLHYLLQQKTGSMLLIFLSAQQKEPKRGD